MIEEGKAWNITSANSFMINHELNPYENKVALWINDQIIHFHRSQFQGSLWLPSGTYRVSVTSLDREKEMKFMAYLSGIEYTIGD